ncbi:MAG: RraA family protein [Gammaproteobacteria bacterium]|nr:RraA family protein [Gammaproteobacteria bacterium]
MDFNEIARRLAVVETTHLADADKGIRVMDAGLKPLRLGLKLIGRAFTVRCREDFLTVMVGLARAAPGDVLVVDTCGSRRAILGELFTYEAKRRGLAGIVVDGPVRDTVTIRTIDLPVYARGATPLAGTTQHLFEVQVPVGCGGVTVNPGDILFGDDDGIIVASSIELETLLPLAEQIEARERVAIARMQQGESLLSMLNFDEHRANLQAGRPSALRFLL